MTRFRVDHPVDIYLVADCGFDHAVGFFVTVIDVRRSKPKLVYDRLQANYDHERPLLGALELLDHEGFLVCLDEALAELGNEDPATLPSGVRRSVEVIEQFKRAAD